MRASRENHVIGMHMNISYQKSHTGYAQCHACIHVYSTCRCVYAMKDDNGGKKHYRNFLSKYKQKTSLLSELCCPRNTTGQLILLLPPLLSLISGFSTTNVHVYVHDTSLHEHARMVALLLDFLYVVCIRTRGQ